MQLKTAVRPWYCEVWTLFAFAALLLLSGAVRAQESSASDSQTVDFATQVAPVLDRRCSGCHVGERAKAGFDILDRDAVLGYIEPGDVEDSVLWTDYLTAADAHADPKTTVMPMNGPLAIAELDIVETWITEGAQWPETFQFISAQGIRTVYREAPEAEGIMARFFAFLGYFHPAIVHFPIALVIFGAAAAALSFLTGGRAVYVAFYCLIWGTLFSVVAAVTGWSLAAEKGYPAWTAIPTSESIASASAVFRHRWLGFFSTIVSIVVLVLAVIAIRKPTSVYRHIWRIGFIVLAIIISIVGHQGGELVYGDIFGKAIERLLGK
ncbi:MAG: c-type cytochrome domain-containing protein [Pirellulaceae bacterium]|nr:c-type cytochrome domain-containing protein [Pirellulaceae bacterium]